MQEFQIRERALVRRHRPTSAVAAKISVPLPGLLPFLFFLLASFAAPLLRGEDPSVSFGAPRWGGNVRLPSYSLGTLPATLRNPDEQTAEVLLSVTPDRTGEGTIVNQQQMAVGPGAVLHAPLRFLSYATESYTGDVTDPRSGALLSREQIASAYETQAVQTRIFVLTDKEDFPVAADISRLNLLHQRVQVARGGAESAPRHWPDYGAASAIVLVRPDFPAMDDAQFQAIRDFVVGGGTLLVVHPETMMEIENTPLADLLPVDPITLRRVEVLPELEDWFAAYRSPAEPEKPLAMVWPDGLTMLESVARPRSHVTASHGPYPLIAWRPVGAGMVGVCTFDATHPTFRLQQAGIPLWNHIFRWTSVHPLTAGAVFAPPLEQAADRLTGFRAAGADTVQQILTANLIFVVLVLLLARLARRQATGWVLLGIYGIGLTWVLFLAAYRQLDEQPSRNLITLEIGSRQVDRLVAMQAVSLFTQHDASPRLQTAAAGNAFLPPITPNIDFNPLAMFQHQPRESWQIRRQDGREHLRNFNLSALRRRVFGCAFVERLEPRTSSFGEWRGATLRYAENGPVLTDFTLPDDLPDDSMVYLTGGGGALRMRPRGDGVWLAEGAGQRLLQLNPVLTRFQEFIAGGWLPDNRLVLLYRDQGDSAPPLPFNLSDDGYEQVSYRLRIAPLQVEAEEGSLPLPFELIAVKPADRAAQTLLWQDEGSYLQSGGSYLFSVELPPPLADSGLQSVTVQVRLQNPDGNAVADIQLQPFSQAIALPEQFGQQTVPDTLHGQETSSGRFVFETASAEDLIDPVSGRFYLRLRVAPADRDGSPSLPGQAMLWRLLELRVEGRATKPSSTLSDHGV